MGLASAGVVAVLIVGWLAWLNLYAAGAAGAAIFVVGFIVQKLAEKYFADED